MAARFAWRKKLKTGKAERYGLDVTNWLDGDTLTSFSIVAPVDSGISVSDVQLSGSIITGIFSGPAVIGVWDIEFIYSTADRNDCELVQLTVSADC